MPAQRNLWTLRLYYFLLIGGGGFLFPFVNLFYTRQGLSGTEIGWLSTIASLVALIAAPWWGRRSDATTHPRRLLQFGLLATSLCMLALSQQTIFAWMALIVSLDALLSVGVPPLSDVVALAVTKQGRAGYGSVRLWGSLGWAVTALVGGWLIEQTGLFTMFAGYAITGFISIALLALLRIPRLNHQPDRMAAPPTPRLRQSLTQLTRDRTLLGLACALSVLLFAINGIRQFEPVFLSQLGAGETIIRAGEHDRCSDRTAGDVVGRSVGAATWIGSIAADVVSALCSVCAQRGHRADDSGDSLLARDRRRGIQLLCGGSGVVHRRGRTRSPGDDDDGRLHRHAAALVRMVSAPVGGWVFDVCGAYALYVIGVIGSALGWLIMKVMVKDRKAEG